MTLVMCCFALIASSQNDFNVQFVIPAGNFNRLSVCGDAQTHTVRFENISGEALIDATVKMDLPVGMVYVGGSIAGPATEASLGPPVFDIGDFAIGEVKTITYDLDITCDGLGLAQSSASVNYLLDMCYTGADTEQNNIGAPKFEVVNPTLSFPTIVGNVSSTNLFDGAFGLTDTLKVHLVNGGEGNLRELTYCVRNNHPNLTLNSIVINGVTVPMSGASSTGDSLYFLFDADEFSFAQTFAGNDVQDPSLFQFNERLIVCEVWEVSNCPDPDMVIPDIERIAFYGCDGVESCQQTATTYTGVRFGVIAPGIRAAEYYHHYNFDVPYRDRPYYTDCYDDPDNLMTYSFAVINTGNANMKLNEFDLEVHAHNYYYIPWALDENSVNFYFKDGATTTPVPDPGYTDAVGIGEIISPTHQYITNCHEGDPTAIWRVEYRDANLTVPPGDTLMIEYSMYRDEGDCGTCSGVYSQYNLPYPQIQNIEYSDECDIIDFASINSGVAPRIRNYNSTFSEGTNNFFSGAVSTTCWNVTAYENYFFNYNCPGNGQPQVGSSYDSDRYHINSPNAYVEEWYVLPEGLDWVGASGDLDTDCITWIDPTGAIYPIYDLEYTDHDCGPDTLKVRYQGSEDVCFNKSQSKFTIKTTPDCGEAKEPFCSKTVNITRHSYYVTECDTDGTMCFEKTSPPRPHTATIHGCFCNPCEGMVFTYLNLSRQTFGDYDPDNDGITEPGTLDTALINTSRFITGDTIRATYGGWVNLIDKPNFEYAYATINVPIIGSGVNALGDEGITPLSAMVQIWDRSTGDKYECDLVQLFPDGQKVVANISAQSLIDLGCTGMPADFVYEQGDSVAVDFDFRLKDFTTTQQSVNFGSEFYLTDEPYDTGTHYQCNTLNQTMTYIPYRAYNEWVYREVGGCNDAMDNSYTGNSYNPIASVYDSHRNLFRLGSTGFDYFPFEVRELAKITKQTYVNNSDLEWGDVFRMLIYDNNGHLTETGSSLSWQRYTLDMTTSSCFAISGNTLVVDFECVYAEVGYERFDEGMDMYATPALSPTCNSEYEDGGTYKDIEVYTEYDMLESMFCSPTWTAIDTSIGKNDGEIDPFNQALEPHFMHHRNSIYGGDYIQLTELPKITLQPLSVNQTLLKEEACFRVDVSNTGSGPANNVFFTLENISGAVVFQGVKDAVTGADIPVNLGVVDLGVMDVGETRELEFCVTSNNCDRDSIQINTGWDCNGLPTSPQEANCTDPVSVYLEIPEAELSMVVLSPDPAIPYFMDLCTEVEHVIQLSSSNIGSIHDINFQFTVPPGMDFVPGSFEIAYPVPSGGTPTWVTTGNQPVNTTGNQYNLVLDPENPLLAANGLPGTTDIGNNFLLVKFDVFVGCGSYSGSRVRFLTWAYDSCDEFTNYRFNPGPVIKINGVADSYVSALSVPDDEILNACEGNSIELGVNFSLALGSLPIGATDSVMVILPEGINYVPNSYTVNMNGEPPSATNPRVVNNNGSETVFFDLLDGVTAGNAVDFTFEVAAMDVAQTCRDYEMIIRTFNSQGVFCDATGEFCDVKTTSDEVSATIEIIKPDLDVSNLEISSCAAPPDMEEMTYCFDLTNTEAPVAAGTTTTVEFYDDTNDNGDFNPGIDVFLASVTTTDPIPTGGTITVCDKVLVPSGMTCNVLAVINPETTCACGVGTSYRAYAALDQKMTTDEWIVCSNDPIADIGPDALDNVTYEWVGINGASTVGFSSTTTTPTNYQFQNTTGATIVWEYYLRAISNEDCASLDTIQITIYPEEHGEVTLQACPFDEYTLEGPTGKTNYQWTPSVGLSDPNASTTNVSASVYPIGVHEFVLTYTDENGCPGDFTTEVTVVKCALTYVGNYVWCDDNNNGIQDDAPVEGFTVQLFGSTDPTTPIASTTTDTNGAYLFGPIPQGEYIIGLDLQGSNYQVAMKDATTDDLDNDLNPNFQTDPFYLSNGDSLTTIDLGVLCPVVDIELTKTAVTNKETNLAEAVLVGDTVYWTIEVCNRVMAPDTINFRADSIQVIDTLPSSLTYLSYTSTQGTYDPVSGIWDVGNIGSGGCPSLCIATRVAVDDLPICNIAEVSRVTDPEIDSTPANDDGDQSEDDEDKAYIYEKRMDLALTKVVSTSQMLPVEAGNDVTFTIEICNQGNVPAYNVQVVDYIPNGMTLNDSDWTPGGLPTEAFITLPVTIDINTCEEIDVTLKIDPSFAGDTLTNFSEISHQEYDDGTFAPDIDSDTDDDPGNDGPVTDQETLNASGDQDDHDPAGIHIEMLECTVSNNGPVCPGTAVTLSETGGEASTWSWSGPGGFTSTVSSPVVDPALPGIYTVSVTDVNGFMETCSTEVTLLPGLEINGTTMSVSCNGGSDGSIDVNVSGGTAPYSYDWDNDGPENPDNDNQDITNLTAGTYVITVTDALGCFLSASYEVNQPTAVSCTASSTSVLCNDGTSGTITVSSAGGTLPYEYSINGGAWQSAPAFTDLAAGTYNVATRDANNCVAICSVLVTEPTALSCNTTSTDLSDCEIYDGTVTVTGMGGTLPYTYNINGGTFSTSNEFEDLIAGTHVITIKDANGCESTCEATLTAPSVPMCTISGFEHIDCNGGNTGSITVTPTGGTAPYEYSLDNVDYQSSTSFTGLSAGLYQVYIRNASSTMCLSMCSIELLEPTPLVCDHTHTDVSCQGGSDGSMVINATGGVTPYEYSIDGGPWQPGATFSGLNAGLHIVTVRDANDCLQTCSQNLMQPVPLTCTLLSTNATCNGTATGTITVLTNGGVPTYEFNINNGPWQVSNQFSDIPAGTQVISVRDANDCISTCSVTITEPDEVSCTLGGTDITDCAVQDGTITVVGVGGTSPFSYAIDGGIAQMENVFENLAAGTHIIMITDANGCASTCEMTLTAPTMPSCQIIDFEDIACKGGDSGSITVAGFGGTAPYEYSLDNVAYQSSNTFSGLTAGVHTVYVRNASSPMCVSTCSKELKEPTELICQHTSSNVSCNGGDDGSILINATGGVTPYEYSLGGGPWQPGFEFKDLEAGSYTVIVRDANLCTAMCEIVINEPSAVSCMTVSADALCNGTATGLIVISATGGTGEFEYNIDNGPWQINNQFTDLATGTYTITTRDENDCTSQCMATIDEPVVVSCTLTGTDLTDCDMDDGTVTTTAVGGAAPYSYTINGGSSQTDAVFTGLIAGTHTVVVTDANGCESNCTISLTAPSTPSCEITSFEHIACKGGSSGSITISGVDGNPPYEYSLDDITYQLSNVFSDLSAGFHVIYVRNVSSPECKSMCGMELTEPTLLVCDHTQTDVTCKDGADGVATINATGGVTAYEYSLDGSPWQPGNTFSGLTAGSYTATVRDANDCTTTCSFTIGEPTLLVCELSKTDVLCNGDGSGSISTVATGGVLPYEYSLDSGPYQAGGSFVGVTGGSHTVTVRDGQNCISTCLIMVSEPDALACTLEYVTPESCAFNDGEISIIPDGGVLPYSFSIDGGIVYQSEMIFSGLPHGDYVIEVLDGNGCTTECMITVEPGCFDLALEKSLVTDPPYVYGQYVVFEIEVENQGNIDATDVEITDHIPCGFSYEPGRLINLANDWTPLATSFPMTTIDNLDQGDTKKVQIELKVEECIEPGGYINVSEISEAKDDEGEEIDDEDSTPDFDPDNDPESEDDHDTELLPIYDPALIKTLTSTPPYSYGSAIEFAITICNQNSNQITNVNVIDYMPIGYSFDAGLNAGWISSSPNVLMYTYNATILQGGECADIPLFLTVEMAGGYDDWRNEAEINSFTDENGSPQIDTDADNDAIMGNDGDMEDNISDNTNDDEDDSDYENIQLIDLALAKTTSAIGPFSYGDQITYDIEVFNQGNQDAYKILVNDFIPCGYKYLSSNDGDWSYDAVSGTASTTLEGPLAPGTSDTISITLEVQACSGTPTDAWTNISEIENFEDADGVPCPDKDIDSKADKDPNNDIAVDNVVDNTGGDEDDNDFEKINVFDLAQIKQIVTEGPYAYGDLLEYKITVINQGNMTATDIVLTDYLPSGFSFDIADNTGWDGTNAPSYEYVIDGPLLSGDTLFVPIFVTLEMTTGGSDNYTNVGEISSASDEDGNPAEDADSDPDNIPDNDGDPNNDATDDPNEEDDHDPETIEVIDLALVKTTAANGPFSYGDQITFDIEIFNQGNVDAYDVVVNDFIPCGYKWLATNEPDWSLGGSIATTTLQTPLLAGDSTVISIILEVQACASDGCDSTDSDCPDQGAWENISEIGSLKDVDGDDITEEDIDSEADTDPNNDSTEDNVNNNANGDEDDNDPEEIEVFDLAQIKKIVTEGPYMYGDTIEYSICVVNQGNVTATAISITDYLPEGLGFDVSLNNDWTETSTDIIEYTIDGPVLREDTICIPIFLTIDMTMGGGNDHTNVSEITRANDIGGNPREDADSTADDDPDNDGEVTNDSYYDEEDDHDNADLMVVDIALVKTTNDLGPFNYGDQVAFDIEVFNQGNIDLYNVVVNDFIPCGYDWVATNSPLWSYDMATGIATTTIAGPLVAGDSIIVSKLLTVQGCNETGAWTNVAEIESLQDEGGEDITDEDVDSNADADPENDKTEDNVKDNSNGDEDDNDLEIIDIYDLSQTKTLITEGPHVYGDTLEFNICVSNQGNLVANSITVTDYLPAGFGFITALNPNWDTTNAPAYDYEISDPLAPQDSVCFSIFVTLESTQGGSDNYTNISEITKDDGEDADSEEDDDPDNDPEEEDDHDEEIVEVVDAALVKTTNEVGPFKYGDQVTFDIEVFNQGNIDLYNVVVNDFIPCGYEWVTSNSPLWSYDMATGIATTTIAGPIVAGDSLIVSKLLMVQSCNETGAWTNVAEIESLQDEGGEDITDEDVDSNADADPSNDSTEDNVKDNTNGDEDDNDLETIDIYDLSQTKTLITEGPHIYGDTLEFNICVSNQGNLVANNITVTDYLPAGFGFITALNPNWDATNAPAYEYEITDALAPQDSFCFSIFVTLESTQGGLDNYTNISEITKDDGEDADSEEDDDPENDPEEEDDHDDEIVEVVDLALVKTTSATGPFMYGDQVTFDIDVFNQGNVDVYDIVVNDFLPCGYKWLTSNEPNWTIADTVATTKIAGPIAAGSSVKVSIILEVQACVTDIDGLAQNAWENISEIESFKDVEGEDITQEDIDSEADDDPTNDETEDNINDNTNGDEDDNDPEEIEVFDLAQIKKIVTEGPYMYGDTIEYTICVVNQGNITAKDISITDYLPEGLGFDTSLNTGWTETSTDIIEYTIADLLAREDTICIPIFLTIDMTMGGGTDHTNVSEITSANDENDNPREDADSTADDDPDNDGEVTNDSYHDEEDDHDNADLMVVDVALVKSTIDEGPFSYGDEITFDIEVFNQGNIDLYNVVVNDFIPCGYEWVASNSPQWSYDASAGIATTIILGPIGAGDSIAVSKTLTIQSCNDSEAWTNVAEVGSIQDESGEDITDQDVDSDADDDPANDSVEDGVNDNTNGDEDDHDPESIDIYDLSQDKTLLTEGPYEYGDTLEYSICIVNQGNVAANTITVTDYLPIGLGFISALNPDWDDSRAPAYDYEIDTPLAPQDSICFSIFVTLESTSGGDDSYTNISEITNDDGEDADSKEDDDPDNDPEEEDDQDEEKFEVFDLAMLKRISNQMPSEGFTFGDLIMYDMVVYNQGNVAAYNVQVCDFIPAGYNYDGTINPIWDGSGPAPTTVCTVIEGPINPGDSATVMIQMELMNLGSSGTIDDYKNIAEIGRAENEDGEEQEDTDSDSDSDPGNDGEEKDDEINGKDGDEDDHDLALPFFMDLAMKKTLAEDYGNVAPGDIITYNLTLFNQGTIDAYNIEVTDHLSPGLTLSTDDINGWDDSSAPSVTKTIAGPLLASDSLIVQIDVIVGPYIKTGDYKNIAEISNYEDKDGDKPDDYDSTSDDDPDNDGEMENDAVEGENGDEDDGDYEDLSTFDLALIKQVATPGPYQTRDLIEFVISVVNQGNVPATEIVIADHVPPGFSFDAEENAGWDDSGAPTYLSIIDGPLMPTDTARVSIFLEIEYLEDATDLDYVNVAEISSAKDVIGNPVDDADSNPDNDPDNDGDSVDDSFDDKDDEDDHDPAGIPSTGLLPPCIPSCDIACVGQLNLSLGESCESSISPSMLLAGLDNACDDPAFMDYFIMELKDERGVPISGNTITADLVGELITYSITVADEIDDDDGTCTNTCWGNILVESKFTPVLDCGVEIDTISCIELPVFDGPPLSGSGTTGCFTADISIEILNEQIINVDPCEGDLVKKVIRQYQAVDVSGGRSNICTQELHITKLDPALISIPVSTSVNLSCNDEIGTIGEDDIRVGVVPFYTPETGSGIPLYPTTDNFCNIFVEYTDEVILDLPCKKQVLRTWEIRQWHCNDEDVISVPPQILTLLDEKPPVLTCPIDTIEVSTAGVECTAKVFLPSIVALDSCNTVSHIDMSYPGGFIENQNGGEISNVPVGLSSVTYLAYDACGNSSSCQVHINVVDNSPPVIICEKHTQVSIPRGAEAHVPATVFDDGSYDDCGRVRLEARRMTLSCQVDLVDSTSLDFGEYVRFCCEDVGTVQMVVLKVVDHSGRENQCMVEVTVVDKNPPAIVAPPDITVSCEFIFDDNDLSVFGSIASTEIGREEIVIIADSVSIAGSPFDGLLIGGCGVEVAEEVDMGDVNSCGTGLIERTFSITSNGTTVSDKQSITVVSPVAFDPDRIVWPRDTMFLDRCTAVDLDPDNLPLGVDRPRLGEGVCELIGSSITDEQIFSADNDGLGCVKVFRKWSVINWCDTDIVTGLPARWDSIQTIGLENRTAPIITSCTDTAEVYNSFDANCNPVSVSLSATATDDCTDIASLSWTWTIDQDNNGTVDTSGFGNEVNAGFIPGIHKIIWYAEDLCGNISAPCSQYFEITNEKAAPAICLDHVVTDLVLMDLDFDGVVESEMVEIWASDVIKEDSHPCGHALSYSFDQAGLQDSVIYGCGEVGFNSVMIYVTNLTNGTQSSCWTEIEVQDNNDEDLCAGLVGGDGTDADVSGLILTESGLQIVETEVKMLGSELPDTKSDTNGEYAFNNMPMGGDYTIVPKKDINHLNGVSTLDLVMIQKHILGLDLLDSPYKMIAADINKSNGISAADIVQLRRLILGESDAFENNESWRFVDELHVFDSQTNPWSSVIPSVYDINNLSSDMIADFVGIKVGDVTSNAKGDELVTAELRNSSDPLTFIGQVEQEGLFKVVEIRSGEFNGVNGFQTTISYDVDQYEFIKVDNDALDISAENIGTRYASRGLLTWSWHSEVPVDVAAEDVLFRLYFRAKTSDAKSIALTSNSKITVQEAYLEGEVTDKVAIEMIAESKAGLLIVDQNEPNPWRESTMIGFSIPDGGDVQIRIFDNSGKLIHKLTDNYGIGYNEITIGRDIISTQGIYLYEIQYKEQVEHKRMVVLN